MYKSITCIHNHMLSLNHLHMQNRCLYIHIISHMCKVNHLQTHAHTITLSLTYIELMHLHLHTQSFITYMESFLDNFWPLLGTLGKLWCAFHDKKVVLFLFAGEAKVDPRPFHGMNINKRLNQLRGNLSTMVSISIAMVYISNVTVTIGIAMVVIFIYGWGLGRGSLFGRRRRWCRPLSAEGYMIIGRGHSWSIASKASITIGWPAENKPSINSLSLSLSLSHTHTHTHTHRRQKDVFLICLLKRRQE